MSAITISFEDAHRRADCSLPPETLAMHPWVSESNAVAAEFDLDAALSDEAVIDRAVERVVTGVNTGTIAMPRNADLATEYLSYPVARIIVSAIDDQRVTTRYINAEADRAIGMLETALWHPSEAFDTHAVFDEFGVDATDCTAYEAMSETRREYVGPEAHQQTLFRIPFEQYLAVATEINDDEWRIINRGVQDGYVHIQREEVVTFVRAAIKGRIGDGLPLPVEDALGERVSGAVDRVTSNIDKDLFTHEIDCVEEGLFPPVIKQMLEDFPRGLKHEEKYALAAFFLNIGMTPDETVETLGVVGTPGEDPTRYQVEHIWRDGDPYTPANYDTIQSWGYEWEKDALEQKVKNPLSYYRIKLDEKSNSGAFVWLDVYGENVSPMLTYPAGPVSMEMDEDALPDGFEVSDDGASWTCDALGDQFATGLALVAVVEGYVEAEDLSMKFLKEMDPTTAVELCVEAVATYGFSRTPPTYILQAIGEVYGFEFVKESPTASQGSWLSKKGKRDAQEAFESLVSNQRVKEFWTRADDETEAQDDVD
jgi:DNA primase large subunit